MIGKSTFIFIVVVAPIAFNLDHGEASGKKSRQVAVKFIQFNLIHIFQWLCDLCAMWLFEQEGCIVPLGFLQKYVM